MNFRERFLSLWNFWPPFLFTGIKVTYISKDFKHIEAKLKLRFWTANYVGTQYGGSIFSLTDAFYMVMLMKNLGKGYIVWDKSACITYLKPGRTDLFVSYKLTDDELNHIREKVEKEGKMHFEKKVQIKNAHGEIVAEVDKVMSIRKKP